MCPDGSSVGGQYVLSNHECVLEFPCPVPIPPPSECSQGVTCSPGSGCGSVLTGNSGCSTSCMCDGTGHYQCSTSCPGSSCSPGAFCTAGTACGGGSSSGGGNGNCSLDCKCNSATSSYVCSMDCQPPPVTDPCPNFAVPDICQICPNGTTECAHAILSNGQCQLEVCPGS